MDDAASFPSAPALLRIAPMPENQPAVLVSRPGAFAHTPGGGTYRWSQNDNHHLDGDANAGDTEAGENNHNGLAMANLVECYSLEFAIPHTEGSSQEREDNSKQYKTFCFLAIIFAVGTGLVLLTVLFSSSAQLASQNELDGMTTNSFPPSQTLSSHLLSLLPKETAIAIHGDSTSPQSRAYHWLLDDDGLHQMWDEKMKQRFALATLYFSTNGDE